MGSTVLTVLFVIVVINCLLPDKGHLKLTQNAQYYRNMVNTRRAFSLHTRLNTHQYDINMGKHGPPQSGRSPRAFPTLLYVTGVSAAERPSPAAPTTLPVPNKKCQHGPKLS